MQLALSSPRASHLDRTGIAIPRVKNGLIIAPG